jgi:pimeloyl-ACP methyl ester carboxylesterase
MGVWCKEPRSGPVLRSRGTALVSGTALHYEAAGSVEFGPTLLFLHESGGSSVTWEALLLALAGEGRCLAPDLPGHGRSEGQGLTSVQAYREWVLGYLDALAIHWPIVLVGLCLGAAIAVDLATVRPDRVAGLILTGTTPGGRSSVTTRELTARGEAPSTFADELCGPGASAQLRGAWLKRWRLCRPEVRHADLIAVAQYDLPGALGGLTHPTLFLDGAQDPFPSAARWSHGRLVRLPHAGGLAPLEQPGRYAGAVREFLATLPLDAALLQGNRQLG